ncbi:hypothetical protein HPC49_52530 [Pyxidicoccus fallax]|uniref:SURF1-like protein n=1 Tax=Pyxidicoccus fallax TaxID=394095 RepID=A0A848M209_9BACT|nr:hypothetical protein [Pyxidicoccus fallax]NMO23513.1 hypothetical protein [Pyxidicoccus fallax]NPC86800.1 hypothetical protein [Pyxidicoccus fallax]
MSEPLPTSPEQEERERRIAELEARAARRRVGVKPVSALFAIAVALVLLGMQWRELAYFVSPRAPLTLGAEGAYRYEALDSNRYAQVHGVPTVRGAYERDGDGALYVLVGLRDSPFVVRRGALPGEEWRSGRPPPQPDQRPFAVRGRLLVEDEAPRYREALALLRSMGEVQPHEGKLWLLIEGEQPGADRGRMLVALALLSFIALNAVLLVKGLRRS